MKWKAYVTEPKRLTSRVFSRLFDYLLAYLVFTFILACSTEILDEMIYIAGLIASPLLWAPIEALLISTIGTTPGKAILGIHVRDKSGFKISYFSYRTNSITNTFSCGKIKLDFIIYL